jgi:hypothetical protein
VLVLVVVVGLRLAALVARPAVAALLGLLGALVLAWAAAVLLLLAVPVTVLALAVAGLLVARRIGPPVFRTISGRTRGWLTSNRWKR